MTGTREPFGIAGLTLALVVSCLFLLGTPAVAQLRPATAGNVAAADNAATAFWNPAGMTRLDEAQVVVQAIMAVSHSKFDVDESKTTVDGGDSDDMTKVVGVPFVFYARPFLDDFRFGFSLMVPAGLGTDYGKSWAGRYITQESTLFFLNAAPSLAYRINDQFSVAAGLTVTYTSFETKSAINNIEDSLADGRIELETSGVGVGGNFALLYEPWCHTRFGLVYSMESDTDLDGVPEFKGLGPKLNTALSLAGVLGRKVEVATSIPRRLSVGVYHEFTDRIAVMADFAWIDWSEFGSVDLSVGDHSASVDADFNDIFMGSIAMDYVLDRTWTLSAGFMYLSEAVSDDKRSLSLPMDAAWGLGIGAARPLGDTLGLRTNLTYYGPGSAPVDTQPNALSGRVAGEFVDNFAIAIDVSLIWG